VELTLAALPTTIPAALPAARTSPPAADTPRPAVGEVPIVIPEDDHECFAYVPETYRADVAHGVILWLPAPGEFDKKNLVGHWKTHCERHDLILLAPRAADPKRWLPTEVPYIRKTLDDLLAKYNIDRTRIVTHGYQGGGGLAYLIAFLHQDLVRGVAAVDAPLPARAHAPATDPIRRQAFHLTYGQSSKQAAAVGEGVKQLQERKYPVTVHVVDGEGRYLNDSELAELVRWIDTLDRL
jgi:hypothetical protein